MGLVAEPFDDRILDGAVHPFDLAIGPGMLGLGCAVIDVVPCASQFKGMCAEELTVGDRLLDQRHDRATPTRPSRRSSG